MDRESLQKIIEISSDVVNTLGGESVSGKIDCKTLAKAQVALKLSQRSLSSYLSFNNFNLSSSTFCRLEQLFQEKVIALHSLLLREMNKLFELFSNGDEENSLLPEKMQLFFQKTLDEECNKLAECLLSAVKIEFFRFHKDVAAASDMESSGESSVAQKGHSPRAVAILEKVFSLTPNINRSEKHQLAKATKLEPRQVTIWFQNRRNRKPTSQTQLGNRLQNQTSGVPLKGKRKSDEMVELVPQTPKLRRQMSESGTPSSFRHDTPHSTSTRGRSSSVELFEASFKSIGGTSCGTSYDDNFSSYQSATSSPPRSIFGLNSFDDQIIRFTNAKKKGSSGDHNKEMMFNENGELLLDWDDLELNMDDIDNSLSSAVTPNFTFPTNNQHIANLETLALPKSTQETNDLIQTFARQLVEEHFDAQQSLNQVQQSEGWHTPVIERLFLSRDAEQDVISLADVQSSQNSNPSGPSTTTSTQTSPKSNTSKSLFDFDFDNLGLDEVMAYNNETIVHQVDAIDLHEMEELLKFDSLTKDMLELIRLPPATSTNTNNDTNSLTLLH